MELAQKDVTWQTIPAIGPNFMAAKDSSSYYSTRWLIAKPGTPGSEPEIEVHSEFNSRPIKLADWKAEQGSDGQSSKLARHGAVFARVVKGEITPRQAGREITPYDDKDVQYLTFRAA